MNDDRVELDTTPTGALGLPRWQYEIRAAAACLEAEPPLTTAFRKHVSDMLGRHQTILEASLQGADTVTEAITDGLEDALFDALYDSAGLMGVATRKAAKACLAVVEQHLRTAAPTAQDDTGARLDAVWDELQSLLPQSGVGAELQSAWDRLRCLLAEQNVGGTSAGR